MEAKINIAEILADKPIGTKLYTDAFGELSLERVNLSSDNSIYVKTKTFNRCSFYSDGKYTKDGEPVLVPSKKMRDWNKFAWKKGDLLTNDCGFQCIFKEWASDDYTKFNGCYSNSRDGYEDVSNAETAKFEKLDDNIAHDYIKTIEKKLGGKFNRETLEVEKPHPEFKDGDILASPSSLFEGDYVFIFNGYDNQNYLGYCVAVDNDSDKLYFSDGNNWCYKGNDVRFATDEDKQRLFDALAKENKAWDAEKKQIVDLKPKWTPKPFDRVITRLSDDSIWTANIFSHIDRYGKYVTIGCLSGYHYCIPYNEETDKLIGTTNNWEG